MSVATTRRAHGAQLEPGVAMEDVTSLIAQFKARELDAVSLVRKLAELRRSTHASGSRSPVASTAGASVSLPEGAMPSAGRVAGPATTRLGHAEPQHIPVVDLTEPAPDAILRARNALRHLERYR
jgi:hypothetical protein